MPRFEKWLTGVGGRVRLSVAARKALQGRLKAVEYFLRRVAEKNARGTEAVHQLRVWTRRSAAAVDLFREVLPKSKRRRLKRKLKKVRQAAGEVRDCDVLLARLAAEPASQAADRLKVSVRKRRKAARAPLEERADHLVGGGKLKRKTAKLLAAAAWRNEGQEPRFSKWRLARLAPLRDEFLRATNRRSLAPSALHELRIAGKRLRYALELVAGERCDPLRTRLYDELSDFQDRLGGVCDHISAERRFREMLAGATNPADREFYRSLVSSEKKRFEQSRRAFFRWWSAKRKRAMREAWEKVS